jgi:two-component system LytT family sensor kinase
MENSFKRDVQNYPLYFLLWTVLGLFYFSQGMTQRLVSYDPTPWWRYLLAWLLGIYIWALLTPVILWLGRRFPVERRNWLRRVALQSTLSAGFAVFELSMENVLYSLLHLFPSTTKDLRTVIAHSLVRGFHGGVLNYWTVLGLQWGLLYYYRYRERSQELLQIQLRASELQSKLVSAQLNALKMQLQPHFLFNTLNAITVLVRQQKSRAAEQMLGYLSDLLRGVLDDVDDHEVSLRRELEYLQLYLSIEQVRFADRLRVEIVVDPATQEASVPQLLLQPLVENAVRHGIGCSSSAGRILIHASTIDSTVEVRVQDDGPGLSASSFSEDRGIGLANTRARLQQLYGEDASLNIENGDRRGAIVTVKFPFHRHSEIIKTYATDSPDRR